MVAVGGEGMALGVGIAVGVGIVVDEGLVVDEGGDGSEGWLRLREAEGEGGVGSWALLGDGMDGGRGMRGVVGKLTLAQPASATTVAKSASAVLVCQLVCEPFFLPIFIAAASLPPRYSPKRPHWPVPKDSR